MGVIPPDGAAGVPSLIKSRRSVHSAEGWQGLFRYRNEVVIYMRLHAGDHMIEFLAHAPLTCSKCLHPSIQPEIRQLRDVCVQAPPGCAMRTWLQKISHVEADYNACVHSRPGPSGHMFHVQDSHQSAEHAQLSVSS